MSLIERGTQPTPDTGAATPPAGSAPNDGQTATPGESQPPVIINNDWYYDDNIKGEGDRPEWLKDKYKSAAEQAKAYVEVEKKLGAFKGAPEEYDLSLQDYPELKFSKEDPMLQDFLAKAKENGVSQEYVTELLTTYAQALTINVPDADAEMKKIGPNAQQDLQILSQWAGQHLDKEEYKAFTSMVTTANAFKVFDKLRQAATMSDITPGQPPQQRETEEQVRALISDPRYETDPAFRADVRRRMALALQGTGKR
jgi:hypothetical protein